MANTYLQPGSDYVLVVDVEQSQEIDGIELPGNVRQKEMLSGYVVSTGPQCTRAFEKDTVMYGPYAGKHVVFGGTEFRILKEGQIELWVRTQPDVVKRMEDFAPVDELDV